MTLSDSKKVKVIDIRNFNPKSELDDFLDGKRASSSRKEQKIDQKQEEEELDSNDEFKDFNQSGGNLQEEEESEEEDEEESEDEDEDDDADEDEDEEGGQEDVEESEDNDKEDDEEDEEESQDGGASSVSSTTRMLSEDPLFLVLSEYLVDKNGQNLVTMLGKINNNLSKLVKYLKD